MEKEPQSLREKQSSQLEEGKAEREPHRPLVPPPRKSQAETLWWELGAQTQASEVSSRERTRIGCVETAGLGNGAPWTGKLYTIPEGV